ncbi:MAG: 4-alpha-glucanotransferase [Deltaproteobacteria bacterium]|nr:4-alpha-glucanotransferase [Deltaproteobacteria bacterium]
MRQAGLLLPLFSARAPGSWGVGEIPDLVPLASYARAAGFSAVQVLPVNEVSRGQNSPYGALSAFAIDPAYASLAAMPDFAAAGGLAALEPSDREEIARLDEARAIAWPRVRAVKDRALDLAFRSFLEKEWQPRTPRAAELAAFCEEVAPWLDDYALFVGLHDDVFAGRPWTTWPAPLRDRDPAALDQAREELSERILYYSWLQWQLDVQWRAARSATLRLGVELWGDLPFMVAPDSADVWARVGEFRLDARVGVPPDAFSATGQDWGLPVFRWDVMEKGGFAWMVERARRSAELYGAYRVDHVVGLYRTYYRPDDGGPAAFTPAEEPAQIRNGETMMRIFSKGAQVIAEDLGVVPGFVRRSLASLGIPGYRVLRWEKDDTVFRDPAAWPAVSVATTGTHDTESSADWYDQLDEKERKAFLEIPGLAALKARGPATFDDGVRDAILELVYASGSEFCLVPFQDAVGSRERTNTPGTVNDQNWSYRVPAPVAELAKDPAAARLRALAERSRRLAG